MDLNNKIKSHSNDEEVEMDIENNNELIEDEFEKSEEQETKKQENENITKIELIKLNDWFDSYSEIINGFNISKLKLKIDGIDQENNIVLKIENLDKKSEFKYCLKMIEDSKEIIIPNIEPTMVRIFNQGLIFDHVVGNFKNSSNQYQITSFELRKKTYILVSYVFEDILISYSFFKLNKNQKNSTNIPIFEFEENLDKYHSLASEEQLNYIQNKFSSFKKFLKQKDNPEIYDVVKWFNDKMKSSIDFNQIFKTNQLLIEDIYPYLGLISK